MNRMEEYRISSGTFNYANMKDITACGEVEKALRMLGALNALPRHLDFGQTLESQQD